MKIYDTLTKQLKELPPKGSKIRMFVCGPTVYDYPHIGHARTYIFFDAFAKYLRHLGYEVEYLQNITDIDDKIINRAKESGKTPKELAEEFEKVYLEDMKSLGISSDIKYARATDYIPQIVAQVKILRDKGYAYEIPGNGWYYDISKFKDYGKLSNRTVEQAEDAVSRIDESDNKRNKGDFALWKLTQDEPSWETELGKGRPGWHIEDTAITETEFGQHYEIHGGASDLKFPHHEAEIAQMEAISGKPLVDYWIHTGLLTVNGQKMSKSLGNFVTIRDIIKNYPPQVLRLMFLMTQFSSPLDYSEQALKQTEGAATNRLGNFYRDLQNPNLPESEPAKDTEIRQQLESVRAGFRTALEDNFNTPKALSWVFNLIRTVNTELKAGKISKQLARKITDFLDEIDGLFGIIIRKLEEIPTDIQELIISREAARNNKNFAEADELREQIKDLGYEIDDTLSGPVVKKRR